MNWEEVSRPPGGQVYWWQGDDLTWEKSFSNIYKKIECRIIFRVKNVILFTLIFVLKIQIL